MAPGPTIRPCRPQDRAAVYEVCVRTGHHGQDATDEQDTPELIAEIWAGPYLALEPTLAFVATVPQPGAEADAVDGDRVVGYVLGARDTAGFLERREREWFPALRERFPLESVPEGHRDRWLLEIIHDRSPRGGEPVEEFPAHLHIDLLPEAQGLGMGRRLIETVSTALAESGARGVHLGASARNERAIAFYRHLGFAEVGSAPGVVFLGKHLTPSQATPSLPTA